MRSLAALVARWQWIGAEPTHGSQASTRAGDDARHAAIRDVADELAQALAGGQTSATAVAGLVGSLRERSQTAQTEAARAASVAQDPADIPTAEWLGRAAAYAWCATDLEPFAAAGE